MRIPGRKTLVQTGRLVRSKLVRHGLILGYHRVNSLSWDPFHLGVSARHFAQHLEVLHQQANVLSLQDLADARASRDIPPRSVAITFDDGYDDYRTEALPLLEQAGFASTIFISTGFLGRGFWWDNLTTLVGLINPADPFVLSGGASKFEWRPGNTDTPPDRDALLRGLHGFLMPLDLNTCTECLRQLAEAAGLTLSQRREDQAMSEDYVARLASNELAEIGCHTVSHPMLARMPPADQRGEIMQGKQALEKLTGRAIKSFSYPYGSLTDASVRLVEECGFSQACASHGDVVWRNSNPFRLPRIWVPDCTGDTFLKLMRRWL